MFHDVVFKHICMVWGIYIVYYMRQQIVNNYTYHAFSSYFTRDNSGNGLFTHLL